jgi:hypothetical protein
VRVGRRWWRPVGRWLRLRSESSGARERRWRGIWVWPRLPRTAPWRARSIRWRAAWVILRQAAHYSGNETAGPSSHYRTPRLVNYEHRLLSPVEA